MGGSMAGEVRSREELRALVDTIPTLAWCTLPDGSNEFLNRRWHEYTGLSPEEAHGWGWTVTIHPDDLGALLATWSALLATGEPGELEARMRRHDGVYRWFLFRVAPLRDERGEVVRWYGTNTDIDDLKRTEARLRRDEREARRITDAIPQAIVVQEPDGTPIYANRSALDYTGLSIEDVRDGFRERIFHPEDLARNRPARESALERGEPFEIEQRARGRDGTYRWFLIRYNPFFGDDGRVSRWYATGTDIEDRKRAEERVRNENVALREQIERSSMFDEIVGASAALRGVLEKVAKVAPTDSTVLVLGETGTGKELIARAIHTRSRRAANAFISVNCAAISAPLIASELFGHERGSFTGALSRRLGRFEAADGGSIFLDEIGELAPETQTALLRVLQERTFERVGGSQTLSADVRVIAATNRDLGAAAAASEFRQDLYYRLNVFPISIPPLRERAGDVPLLVEYLVDRYAKAMGKRIRAVSKKTLRLFQAYDWPGNVRELQNVIERAVILCDSETFEVEESWLTQDAPRRVSTGATSVADLARQERELLESALRATGGRISGPSGASARLGIPRQTLESKLKRFGIDARSFRSTPVRRPRG